MCARSDAMREVREAACKLSMVCLGIDPELLRDGRTLKLLPEPREDFESLLALLDK